MCLYRSIIYPKRALYKNKYRIEPARLRGWDYGANPPYFVTICTKNREAFFGHVAEGFMNLSEVGRIAYDEWIKSPEIRPDMNIELGEYVIMPNHFHGIILIGENEYNRDATHGRTMRERDAKHGVSTGNKFGPQSHNLASVIRGFKSSVTIQARKINPGFAWQPLFYDQIIRNERSFTKIQNYIVANPLNWKKDKFFI